MVFGGLVQLVKVEVKEKLIRLNGKAMKYYCFQWCDSWSCNGNVEDSKMKIKILIKVPKK